MTQPSYARRLLRNWAVPVEDIPTSELERKKEADFLAVFGNSRVLIEEKNKEDDPEYLIARAKELEQGQIHAVTVPLGRDETISGVIGKAARQLRSSSDKLHDYRLMWFTATGWHAQAKYEQFMATLYGRTNIFEMNADSYRRCYYFRNSDFFRHATVLDGAIAAYIEGGSIIATMCLNSLSPRYPLLRKSEVLAPFGTAVEDPGELEAKGTAFVLDSDLNRKEEAPLLAYLQAKYKTRPLMTFNLGYTSVSTSGT